MGIILEKQDLTYLDWSHVRSSSGTAGTFLKSQSTIGGKKTYYKLSNFDATRGVIGHECINELIACRLLQLLGVDHLEYDLIHADIDVDGRIFETYLCASTDFKKRGESKVALDDLYRANKLDGESAYDFCRRQGWSKQIDQMIAVDFLILNRDRHGANIEVLRNTRARTLRIAPLFDHGLSLLCSCSSPDDTLAFDVLADKPCNNFFGGKSCRANLDLIDDKQAVFPGRLRVTDRYFIFEGLEGVMPDALLDKTWEMIYERYRIYESL